LIEMIDKELNEFYSVRDNEIPEFNQLVLDAEIPPVEVKEENKYED